MSLQQIYLFASDISEFARNICIYLQVILVSLPEIYLFASDISEFARNIYIYLLKCDEIGRFFNLKFKNTKRK